MLVSEPRAIFRRLRYVCVDTGALSKTTIIRESNVASVLRQQNKARVLSPWDAPLGNPNTFVTGMLLALGGTVLFVGTVLITEGVLTLL